MSGPERGRHILERLRRGRPEKSMIITGLRGVGKTVLLNTFGSIAEQAKFATASTEITHETEFRPLVARLVRRALLSLSPIDRMKKRARRAAAVFKAFALRLPDGPEISIDVEVDLGRGDSGDLAVDLADLFLALGGAAADHGSGVVFLLDEIQFLGRPELEALIAALHRTSQQGLPVTLVGAGLPQIPELTGAAKSYSERLFDFPQIGSLPAAAAREALVIPVRRRGRPIRRSRYPRDHRVHAGLSLLPSGIRQARVEPLGEPHDHSRRRLQCKAGCSAPAG